MTKNALCEKYRVSGRVQGVWFRQSTLEQAQALGLTGWARNLGDGCVEVMACGSREELDRLRDWLWQGPPAARVDEVTVETVEETPPRGFEIRY